MLSVFIGYILELVFGKPKWMPDLARDVSLFAAKTKDYFFRHFKDSKIAGIALSGFILAVIYLSVRFLLFFNLDAVLIYFALSIKDAKNKLIAPGFNMAEADAEQITKAKIEFIALNTVRDILGVLLYAFLGGPVLAWAYKAVNAVENVFPANNNYGKNMVWFNRVLAGAVNYFPSRICIPLIWLASYFCKFDAKSSFKTAWNEGRANNTIAEAAFAGSLGIQLGGLSYYNGLPVHKPYVGMQAVELKPEHMQNALKLMYISSAIFLAILIVINYFWNVL